MTTETNTAVIFKRAPGLTPDEVCDARARALAFVFDCWKKKNAAAVTSNDGDEPKGSRNDRPARSSIP